MSWAIPPRTARAASPDLPPAPTAPSRTDPASPDVRRAVRRARDGRCRRRHGTWGRRVWPPGPAHRVSVVRLLQLLQDPIDVLRVLEPAVQVEMQLRARAQMQLLGELRPQKPRGARQALERRRLFF